MPPSSRFIGFHWVGWQFGLLPPAIVGSSGGRVLIALGVRINASFDRSFPDADSGLAWLRSFIGRGNSRIAQSRSNSLFDRLNLTESEICRSLSVINLGRTKS